MKTRKESAFNISLGKIIVERDEFGIRQHSVSIFKTSAGKEYWFYDANLGVAMLINRAAAKQIVKEIFKRKFEIR